MTVLGLKREAEQAALSKIRVAGLDTVHGWDAETYEAAIFVIGILLLFILINGYML